MQRIALSRTVYAYKPIPRNDKSVITALLELVERYPCYGFAKYFAVLRREGHTWHHKRVYRIYRQLQLNMQRKGKRRLPIRAPVRLEVQTSVNACWSVDFMSDALLHGLLADVGEGLVFGYAFAVVVFGQLGVVDVDDGHELRFQGNLGAFQALGIARSVPIFVMA